MKASTSDIKINWDSKKKQWHKYFGRKFWLGDEQAKALRLALDIRVIWQEMEARGATVWDEEDLIHVDMLRTLLYDPSAATEISQVLKVLTAEHVVADNSPATAAAAPATNMAQPTGMLSDAVAAHQKIVRSLKGRTSGWNEELARRIGVIVDTIGDMSLATFGHDQIMSLMDSWVAKCKDETYSYDTTKDMASAAKQFVSWLDASDRFGWRAPRRWEKLFKLPSILPRDDEYPRVFDIDELQRLYQNIWNDRLKLLMLLGLNCGFCQSDCATLTPAMIHLKDNQIRRPRHKTKQPGSWVLWPETAGLIKAELKAQRAAKNDEPLLRTQHGELLVRTNIKGKKLDSVASLWKRLEVAAGMGDVPKSSFKYLRKTGSQLVRNDGGADLANAFLCHRTRGLGGRYHGFQDWNRLHQAITAARDVVAKMFEPLSPSPANTESDGV